MDKLKLKSLPEGPYSLASEHWNWLSRRWRGRARYQSKEREGEGGSPREVRHYDQR